MRRIGALAIISVFTVACGDSGPGGSTSSGTTDAVTTGATTTTATGSTGAPTTSAGGTGSSGGVQPECLDPSDCPTPPTCQEPTCEAGACGAADLPEGTPVDDIPGDCRTTVCDGGGGTKDVPADDPPGQVPGDCKLAACLQGQVEYSPADDDLPDDTNECTVDSCDAGQPVFTARPVNSLCGPNGSQFCHGDATCQPCKEVSDACEDFGSEPHETQAAAFTLGQITDADADGSFACGTLKGPADVDWFTFSGVDALLNVVDPSRSLIAQNDAGRVCVYLQCGKGTTTVNCAAPDTPDTAPMGQKGCCGTGTVAPALNCGGLDDSAKVWIKLDNPDAIACIPYQLDYHF